MENVNIVIVCSNGRNRSRFLKQYLLEKGYYARTMGMNNKPAAAHRRLKKAKIVISVHPEIKKQLCKMHDLEGKKIISLNVDELTANSLQGKKMNGEDWLRYQQTHTYPELKRQIQKHLPTLERLL